MKSRRSNHMTLIVCAASQKRVSILRMSGTLFTDWLLSMKALVCSLSIDIPGNKMKVVLMRAVMMMTCKAQQTKKVILEGVQVPWSMRLVICLG